MFLSKFSNAKFLMIKFSMLEYNKSSICTRTKNIAANDVFLLLLLQLLFWLLPSTLLFNDAILVCHYTTALSSFGEPVHTVIIMSLYPVYERYTNYFTHYGA